ncbi:MAG: hypothetical protein JXB48_13545 [Candidatus Latescibacteria bacterium]|nr:hypothetical protein [Candidatus Latescibacterota bacterium]
MARIKINDLPKDQKVSRDEMKKIRGGLMYLTYNDVSGEAQDKDHKGWTDLLSFTWK